MRVIQLSLLERRVAAVLQRPDRDIFCPIPKCGTKQIQMEPPMASSSKDTTERYPRSHRGRRKPMVHPRRSPGC